MRITLLLLFFTGTLLSQSIENCTIKSEILDQNREILIFKPKSIETNEEKRYHVVYVFDSQSREMFDLVHSTIAFLKPYSVEYLIVGVKSPYLPERKWYRNTEMLPEPKHPETVKQYNGNLGKADSLLLFVEQELIPYVERRFEVYSDRTVIGHSNSATFVMNSLMEKPKLFRNVIALSPNFAFDKGLLSRKLNSFDCAQVEDSKFLFLSHANENDNNGWRNWKKERDIFYANLKILECSSQFHVKRIELVDQQHMKSYPEAVSQGLKSLIDHQYYNLDGVKTLLNHFEKYDSIKVNSDMINSIAYENYYVDNNQIALDILSWAIELYPEDDNLYDSMGEILEYIGKKIEAKKYYIKATEVLAENKNLLTKDEIEERMKIYKDRLEKLK